MNALLASFIGFVVGGVLVWFVLVRLLWPAGFRMLAQGHPESAEHMGSMARLTCWSHAGMLDEQGYTAAAAFMILAGRSAKYHPEKHLGPSGTVQKRLSAKYEPVVKQGNLMFPNPANAVNCHEHGESPWAGHIQCSRCLKMYESADTAPQTCACGWRLLPESRGRLPLASTGGRICRHCFEDGLEEPTRIDPPTPAQLETPVFELPMEGLYCFGECPNCEAELYLRFGDSNDVQGYPPSECPVCLFSPGAPAEREPIPLGGGAETTVLAVYERLEAELRSLRAGTDEDDPDGADALLDELEVLWGQLSEGERQRLAAGPSKTWPELVEPQPQPPGENP